MLLKILRNIRAQNTAEYAVLIALVVGAAVAMQTYVKRNLQGGMKYVVDRAKANNTATGQYEPYYLQSDYDVKTSAYSDTTETALGGKVIREYGAGGKVKNITRTGNQTILSGD